LSAIPLLLALVTLASLVLSVWVLVDWFAVAGRFAGHVPSLVAMPVDVRMGRFDDARFRPVAAEFETARPTRAPPTLAVRRQRQRVQPLRRLPKKYGRPGPTA
jgi:hypothetical protein